MSEVDSIGLLAKQSYTQIQDRPKIEVSETPMVKASSFHDIATKQFNSFANLSPEQILSRIQSSNSNNIAIQASSNGSLAANIASTVRGAVSKQEQTARKSLIGEASLVELLTATTEAKNVVESTVKVRDKFMEAFDKVMNMTM